MVNFLVPFILVMLYALFVPNGKNKHVGYLGALAGLLTVFLLWTVPPASFTWFSVAGWTFSLTFLMDTFSLVMASLVAGIGVFVFWYSTGYFKKTDDLKRYYVLLLLFAWSMLGVVTAGNVFQLFFCWELVGVSSFLLIGFWNEREDVRRAATKAFMTILTGDVFFLSGLLVLVYQYQTLDILQILSLMQPDALTMFAGFCIIVGGISKSAQFPLHGWLADAMVGPTPVSAYLHSATMVKAGLFVILRFLPLLVLTGLTPLLTVIAIITIIMSVSMALVATDIKQVLAYSTMNQLGFMLLAFSIGAVVSGMFHLVTHAIFKALLFFVAGIVIHTTGTQNLNKAHIKWSWSLLPVSALVGVLALSGLVPFVGFFSKEAIFENVLHAGVPMIIVFSLAILFGAAYSLRWFLLIFKKTGRKAKGSWQLFATLPLLALLAIGGGLFFKHFFVFFGEQAPHLVSVTAICSTLLVLCGMAGAYYVIWKKKLAWLPVLPYAEASRRRFLMDSVYAFAAQTVMLLARVARWIDDAILHRFVRLVGLSGLWLGTHVRRIQTGSVQIYVLFLIIGFVLMALSVGGFI